MPGEMTAIVALAWSYWRRLLLFLMRRVRDRITDLEQWLDAEREEPHPMEALFAAQRGVYLDQAEPEPSPEEERGLPEGS